MARPSAPAATAAGNRRLRRPSRRANWLATTIAGAAEPAIWRLPDERLLKAGQPAARRGGLALVFSDITRETALASRINQLSQVRRAILDTLTEAVAVFAGDGRLMLHNRAFERFFGWRPTDRRAAGFRRRRGGCACPGCTTWPSGGELKGRVTDVDPGVRAAAGGELRLGDGRWAAWRSRPLPDGATLVGFADATHERRLAEALAEREAALGEAARMRRAFVASVSYEMRIPLTTVLGYCDLIERGGRLVDARDRTWLAAARVAAGQLAASIEDVLTLAELDAGELTLELETVGARTTCSPKRPRRAPRRRARLASR